MHIDEQQYYQLVDDVLHEGDPELVIGPADDSLLVPAAWAGVLAAAGRGDALRNLWLPVADRLPRVCRALQERLQGIGFLRTNDVPASLLYFFGSDGAFQFRGRSPLSETELATSRLPPDFLQFYRLHDGWTLYFSRDNGPLPSAEWLPPDNFWEDVKLKMPPGEASAQDLKVVFRSGEELLFAFDTSKTPALPLVVRPDGTVEPLADMWAAIDREIGGFMEELDSVPEAAVAAGPGQGARRQEAARHCDEALGRIAASPAASGRWSKAMVHRQANDLLVERTRVQRRDAGTQEGMREVYRKALTEWCAGIEAGGEIDPGELMDHFGLAHALDDSATAHFIATIPLSSWGDGSLAAVQVNVLFRLFLGDFDEAEAGLEHLLGMTFDGEEPPGREAETVARLLQCLLAKNSSPFAQWRREVVDQLCSAPSELNAPFPWKIRLSAFDSVAFRLGMVDRMELALPFMGSGGTASSL